MSDRSAHRLLLLQPLPAILNTAGHPATSVLRRAGIDVDPALDPMRTITRAQLATALEIAAGLLRDETLGLRLGAAWQPNLLGPLGQATLVAPTVASAIRAVASFIPTLQACTAGGVSAAGDDVEFSYHLQGGDPERLGLLTDAFLAFVVTAIRRAAGQSWHPLAVQIERRQPANESRYAMFFGAPVRYRSRAAGVVLQREVSAIRLPEGSAAGLAALEAEAAAWSRSLPTPLANGRLTESLNCIIEEMLKTGQFSCPDAAATLGLPLRTLQHRLLMLRLNFTRLVDQKRRVAAVELLSDRRLTIADVALRLGYTNAANFTRAFRRWWNTSPRNYRTSALPGFGRIADRA